MAAKKKFSDWLRGTQRVVVPSAPADEDGKEEEEDEDEEEGEEEGEGEEGGRERGGTTTVQRPKGNKFTKPLRRAPWRRLRPCHWPPRCVSEGSPASSLVGEKWRVAEQSVQNWSAVWP